MNAAAVACPACRATITIPDALRHALSSHGASAVAGFAAVRAEAASAATERATKAEQERRGNQMYVIYAVAMVALMILSYAFSYARVPNWLGTLIFTPVMLLLIFAMLWYPMSGAGKGTPAPIVSPVAAPLTCPGCGGPHTIQAADPAAPCRHCGTAVVPTSQHLAHASATAMAVVLRERMARYREERRHLLRYRWSYNVPPTTVQRWAPVVGGGVFSLLMLPLAVTSLTGAAEGRKNIGMFVVLTCGGALFAYFSHQQNQNDVRTEHAVSSIAHELMTARSGQGLPNPSGWLDAWWAAPLEGHLYPCGAHYRVIALQPLGYQVLLVLNLRHVGMHKGFQPTVQLMLSAWIPGITDRSLEELGTVDLLRRSPTHVKLVDAIEMAGFRVEPSTGGLLCFPSDETMHALRSQPEKLHVLPYVLDALTLLATYLGAQRYTQPLP
ncbi:hypothetical protein [Chondromyces crocatus]|uniref:hypothetical protein n=1 Tax=Chondromyces crocatus TaxID=52 RepID=UPI00067C3F34|nr:hypothetical protein [Chondromyces crocatus]